MKSLFRYVAEPSTCGYLPEQQWSLEYEFVASVTSREYGERMARGWRRFGHALFRPACTACSACRSLRVVVPQFRWSRWYRRLRRLNEQDITLRIGVPRVTRAKMELYDRYHAFQAEFKGWPVHAVKDAEGYEQSFVRNPFPTQEWSYFHGERLVGVGYVDVLPVGLSAIYYFHDPDYKSWSLGTWNVLCIIDQAARQGIEHVYLGYFVEGCPSMTYKARFTPNEVLGPDGTWESFRS